MFETPPAPAPERNARLDRPANAPEPAPESAFETPALPTPEPLTVDPGRLLGTTLPDDLDVVRTRWHPRPDQRVAYLSLPGDRGTVEYTEGEFYGEWVVKEIQLTGVVFEYDGATIVRSVGRSK